MPPTCWSRCARFIMMPLRNTHMRDHAHAGNVLNVACVLQTLLQTRGHAVQGVPLSTAQAQSGCCNFGPHSIQLQSPVQLFQKPGGSPLLAMPCAAMCPSQPDCVSLHPRRCLRRTLSPVRASRRKQLSHSACSRGSATTHARMPARSCRPGHQPPRYPRTLPSTVLRVALAST